MPLFSKRKLKDLLLTNAKFGTKVQPDSVLKGKKRMND